MSSEEVGMGPSHSHSSHSNQLVFQDDALPLRFNCSATQRRVGDPGSKTRELSCFIDDKLFYSPPQGPHFRRTDWNGNGSATTPSAEDSDEDEDDDDDEVDDADGEVERLVADVDESNINHNSGNQVDRSTDANTANGSGSVHGGADKMGNGNAKHHHSTFGSSCGREVLVKDGNVGQSVNETTSENHHHHQQQQGSFRLGGYQNAVTIAEPDGVLYYSQYLHGTEGSAAVAASASPSGHKDAVVVVDNGCGFSGRKDVSLSSESGESLRAILSDPVTGALMDDAMILPCGHSFGGGGLQHVTRMKACYSCSQSITEDSIAPNLSLRAAVQAFRREEELQFYRSSKRRRERFDQDKGGFCDSTLMDPPRGRGVQFPFAVMDRVIIKGNKRTPQRFVGREAIVTTQCLNGWYVVKTLDNAESVKLQYRSLAKVDDPSSKSMSSKMAPNWL
ncbi:U-box domain-containing protein 62 [Morella rubra]|uniref:U-box domain-containing protein 62 n=1 Tax=Morella rubra TaxID=262757 RepID=A0A6A1VXY0_9ROSI|nr:U-box domain-containing protein 62 [Morella rubra]